MSGKIRVRPLGAHEKLLPLFVDVGVEIIEMGMFHWKNTNIVSYFPILVQPRNFPNLYISAAQDPPSSYDRLEPNQFNPFSYKSDRPCALVIPPEMDRDSLGAFAATVLNPMGVGVFYISDALEGTDGYGLTLRKAPYAMEMVNRLIYCPEPGDDDWDAVTYRSLEMLMYRLKPASLQSLSLATLREEFIYRYLVLMFPPSGLHRQAPVSDLRGLAGEWIVAFSLGEKECKVLSVKVGDRSFSVPFLDGRAAFLCPEGVSGISVDGDMQGVELSRTGVTM